MRKPRKRNILLLVLLSDTISFPSLYLLILIGNQADAVVCQLEFTYVEITDKHYSVVCGFMCKCISIAIIWATHCCL